MKNKKTIIIDEIEENEEHEVKEVKLKSEMYNNDNEFLEKREDEENSDAVMWGFVIGFVFFFILLIMMICLVN